MSKQAGLVCGKTAPCENQGRPHCGVPALAPSASTCKEILSGELVTPYGERVVHESDWTGP